MLKYRVIPTLLWKNVGLVKGEAFDSWRRVGTVLPAIKVYNTREVDELILLDITASAEQREPDYDSIQEFSADCFVPLTVGGGIQSIDHITRLLRSGADKVSINSAAYDNPDLVRISSQRFGAQCIVGSIDARRTIDGGYECYSQCGTKATGKEPGEWARELQQLGAGEILITSVELDGTMKGYDLELIKRITDCVTIPVIASGGASGYQDFADAILLGNAAAVAAASIFHFTQQTPKEAKKFLSELNIPVRIFK
ncbi:MAG: imidazole glycerol phosphate synthase cyclase subunit [Paenibacillaceae bacterium]